MNQTAYEHAQAQALAMPAYDFSLWSLILDPPFLTMLVFAVLLMSLARWSPLGRKYIKKQSDYLDHQRSIGDRVVEQNKAFEDMIAKQYAETNDRTDKAIAQSDEVIRLHASSLEQLANMNQALTRLAAILETDKGGRPA